jgi:dihydrofolate reductase
MFMAMRDVILSLDISLDGYIADANGSTDWALHHAEEDRDYFDFSIDAVLLDTTVYERICRTRATFFPSIKAYVFAKNPPTHTPPASSLNEAPAHFEFISDDPIPFVRNLKQQAGNNIWLNAGHSLVDPLLDARLVDQLLLDLNPILLGAGTPLTWNLSKRLPLKRSRIFPHKNGLITITYDINNG